MRTVLQQRRAFLYFEGQPRRRRRRRSNRRTPHTMKINTATAIIASAIRLRMGLVRSEERRVGKECRSRRSTDHEKKKRKLRARIKSAKKRKSPRGQRASRSNQC